MLHISHQNNFYSKIEIKIHKTLNRLTQYDTAIPMKYEVGC